MIDFAARLSTLLKRDNSVRAATGETLIEIKQGTPPTWWRKNPWFIEYMIHEGTALLVKQKEQHRIVLGRIGKTERGGIAQHRCHWGTWRKSAHSWSPSDGCVGRERLRPLTTRVILRFAQDDTVLPPRR